MFISLHLQGLIVFIEGQLKPVVIFKFDNENTQAM